MTVVHPILIVDGDVSLRNTLVAQLNMHGQFETSCAGSLTEAEGLLRARDGRFDLLVLDIKLPTATAATFALGCAGRSTRCRLSCLLGAMTKRISCAA